MTLKSPRLKYMSAIAASILALSNFNSSQSAMACTRAVYLGDDNTVITTRSLDWAEDMKSNLWVFPRGMQREGAAGPNSVKWTSKYGSVITSGYDFSTCDGMNETGLVANVLWLAEANYGKTGSANQNLISVSAWTQYVLDNYSTVPEVVAALEKGAVQVASATMPGGRVAGLHLAVTDPSGDTAVFEYIDGKLVVHHDRTQVVMTNSPTFDQQLALNSYWQKIGGLKFLPGTISAADRFARASFYMNSIPKTGDRVKATAQAFSVIRSISVPLGLSVPDQPNIASTLWRTVSDQKNKLYYFDSATSPDVFWVKLSDLDFSPAAGAKKLTISGGQTFAGNVSSKFEKAEAFKFLPSDGVAK